MRPCPFVFCAGVAFLLMLPAGTPHAAEVSMANGAVKFQTPASWLDIMDTEGDPEARVFQVPDPSPSGKNNLARVTVTVARAADIKAYQQYMATAMAKATQLPGYQASTATHAPNEALYGARENGTEFSYVERYWFKAGHAIQLRCVRPTQSEAGASWTSAFDKGCEGLAKQLQ